MQLGGCWFDPDRGLLTEQSDNEPWHLPRAELQVLRLLVENEGKLVSKHVLKTGDGEYPPLTDTSLVQAIFMIRSFLGPQYEGLIETVKGQGYLLHGAHGQRVKSFHYRGLQSLPWWSVSLVFGFMLAFTVFYLNRIDHSALTEPLVSTEFALASGQHMRLQLYTDSELNNTMLLELGERLEQGLIACGSSNWTDVYSSLSLDKQVLNITMRGEELGQPVIRNLKISDFRRPKEFIDVQWLLEVGICG